MLSPISMVKDKGLLWCLEWFGVAAVMVRNDFHITSSAVELGLTRQGLRCKLMLYKKAGYPIVSEVADV